ncbi:hypothetical protein IRZ71_09625 [Flavobacterium sp. ANB]|uniref:hypothetical protein n=1 Tax=unclassified Flavobacterium TaxID=196869 RepID=UPI0012B8DBBE|nr:MULTISPECIES: hypothetical protein [unclassified Flavobacterium]MBF4516605.1 hypothetical protein [Flavobacterium sp. ANB]MTD69498.1 hypothetical protein [Flavobacterium sp. LC2016-13]
MKNTFKLYLTLWVALFTFLNVNAQCETIRGFFKDDMYTSKELVTFAEKDPQKAFDSWKVLYNEKAGLAKNIEELNLVSKNLDEIGKVGGYLKWKSLKEVEKSLTGALKSTYDDILRSGGSVVENNGTLKLLSKNGDEVAQISNGKILPTKYFDDILHSGATPIGQPANGYQVFKKGDDLVVKRMPDKSAYTANELTELQQHPKGHTLERHGYDVTDEALIKRANEGIAPDGSYIGNNPINPPKPPYSSKFETPQQLQKALNNTRPGTPAFNSTPIVNGRKTVIHELTDGTTYGKGVPKDGTTFQQAKKVRAGYEEVSPNNWQLVTMFPDF